MVRGMWRVARALGRRTVAVDIGTCWVHICTPGGEVIHRPAGGDLRALLQQAFVAAGAARNPDVVLCARPVLDQEERTVLEREALAAGARAALAMESGLAAAIGADLPVAEEHGCLVADVGAGRCEAVMVAGGRVVRVRAAEYAAHRDRPPEDVVVDTALRLLEDVWREGRVDALDHGLTVVGGGARVPAVVDLLARSCPVSVRVPERPEEAVVRGAARVFEEARTFARLAARRR